MKKKYHIAILMGCCFTPILMGSCGGNTSSTGISTTNNEISITDDRLSYAGQTVQGTVLDVSADSIIFLPDGEENRVEIAVDDSITVTQRFFKNGESEPPKKPNGEEKPNENENSNENKPSKGEGNPERNTPPKEDAGSDRNGHSGNEENRNDIRDSMHQTIKDIQVENTIEVTFDESGNVTQIALIQEGGMGGDSPNMGGMASSNISYTAVNEFTVDTTLSGDTITSTGTDENVVLVTDGANVLLDNVAILRSSSDSAGGDNSSFYGVGASILTTDGTITVTDSQIDSTADGGAGVFSYGDGISYVSNTSITTTGNTSGGIHAAGGGTLYAWNLMVDTSGESSAAIRSDRGGGTMVVDGGSYTSNGTGSPAVYCTAKIAINDASLKANGSEAVCIEGLNSLRLFHSDLMGCMRDNS